MALSPRRGVDRRAGLALHTGLDGAAVAGASITGALNGILVGAALVLHQAPVGAAAAALALTADPERRGALWAGTILAGASMAGATVFALAAWLAPLALPLMAGVTVHVIVHDLWPTLGAIGWRRAAAFAALGTVVYLLTERLLHLGH